MIRHFLANTIGHLGLAFLNGYSATTTDPDRLGLPKPFPTQRPKPAEIPTQRPKPSGLERQAVVGIRALARMNHRAGTADVLLWNAELAEEHVIGRLLAVMEEHDAGGLGW